MFEYFSGENTKSKQGGWATMTNNEKIKIYGDIKKILSSTKFVPENIVGVYDDEVLLDYIVKYTSDVYTNIYLQYILPKTDRNIIINLVMNSVNVGRIESIINKLNINAEDKYGNICLKYACDYSYLVSLLSSNLKFDINHKNYVGETFIMSHLKANIFKLNEWKVIINLLGKRGYDFDYCCETLSLLDMASLFGNSDILINIIDIVKYDISRTSSWLNVSFGFSFLVKHRIVDHVLGRCDYVLVMNNLIRLYAHSYAGADDDILYLLKQAKDLSDDKFTEIMKYCDKDGNNILHICAKFHLDKTIYFLGEIVDNDYMFGPNNFGKVPLDIYNDCTIVNKLRKAKIITLF